MKIQKKILSYVNSFLLSTVPDVVLVGLSTPGEGGVDEAALAMAECPTFMIQDFWGDSNLFFGKHPDYYLVMDDEAKSMTDSKYNISSIVVGSPRHAKYAKLNFDTLKEEMFERLGLCSNSVVHGFFCQPIFCSGYLESVEAWADTVKILRHDKVIYRPHPGSPPQLIEGIEGIFKERALDYIVLNDGDVEGAIVICTSVSSVISNSNLDVAYVNHFSSGPMAVPIYLLYHSEVVKFIMPYQDVDMIPTVRQGLALLIRKELDILSVLKSSTNESTRENVWNNSQCISDPRDALRVVKELLLNSVNIDSC